MQSILEVFIILFLLSIHPELELANSTTIPVNDHTDYQALLAIKAEISNDPDSALSSWNSSLHFCQWEGIVCGHRHQRVVGLDLSSRNLVGPLSPFIGNLSFLHVLNLYGNFFRGEIPLQISQLRRLQVLNLTNNHFEGEIPANLSRCVHLAVLFLNFNNLVGKIPSEVATLPNLVEFSLASNNLSGRLQDIGIGNMSTSLQTLYLDWNHIQGSIPPDIARLKGLKFLALGDSLVSGTIPTSLFNLSSLITLYLSRTKIHGNLPQDIGLRLPNLRYLFMTNCFLTGQFPTSISNLSKLEMLSIGFNSFTGGFPFNGNYLPRLSHLKIDYAFSLGGEAGDLSFLESLTNCTKLTQLLIGGNSFSGTFSNSILNFSTSLKVLELHSNLISGHLPLGLGKFVNLYALDIQDNNFIGPIPADIGRLKSMQLLYFSYNNFSGEIPSSMGNLTQLSTLSLQHNNLEGSLPKSLGNCLNLQYLYLYSNKLSGVLFAELFEASSLLNILIGQNNIQGSIPIEINNLMNLVQFDVSQNRFSGEIPSTLDGCTGLTLLDMSQNSFIGSIPQSLSPLKSIQTLDLSYNNLSGRIPSYFSSWPYLSSLNLSFNNLEGEVPTNRVFVNTSIVSIVGNSKLCGGVIQLHLPKCPPHRELKKKRLPLEKILIVSAVCVLIIILLVGLCFYFLFSSRKRKGASSELQSIRPFLEVSYQMLSRATDGFSSSNLIGVGGFGYVYKGILHHDGTKLAVAVKVMNLHNEGASKSFLAECRALRIIRHRNLVKIITACSSIDAQRNDFKALVYEFMPMGSLESWLHSSNIDASEQCLSLFQRLSIAIDVACALEYLHTGCATPVIHCDLKPSNILLDDDMTAHVGDFGLAKFLLGASTSDIANQTSSSHVNGTLGYAAPEYGLGSKVSPEGDIYSFGIIILEMMTSNKPTNTMFCDGLSLHGFAKSSLPNQVMEIVDQRMLGDANMLPASSSTKIKKIDCIMSMIMIGVQCSLELPQERMSIKDVVNELKSARQNLLSKT